MARFDVRANLNRSSRERVPYLIELQKDLLAGLATRLVAPLAPAARFGPPASRLNPVASKKTPHRVLPTGRSLPRVSFISFCR